MTLKFVYDYLTENDETKIRVRKRGYEGIYIYPVTRRRFQKNGDWVESKRSISKEEYRTMLECFKNIEHMKRLFRREGIFYGKIPIAD